MNIVSSVGSVDSKTDSGFKEVLSKVQKHILIVHLQRDMVENQ